MERISVLSLDDLAPDPINVEIEQNGRIKVIPLREIGNYEFVKLGYEVPNPVPPTMGVDKNGRPLLDFNDPTSLRARADAEMERGYVRLLAMLAIDIPGETKAEQLAALKKSITPGVMRQLMDALNKLLGEGDARIVGRAETFLSGGTGDPADLPGDGVDTGAI
jgi:hypothetical protein